MVSDEHASLDFDPHNLPDNYLKAIGLAMAASAQTEDTVQMAIAGILGVDGEIGWALTAHMSAPLRDSIARSLVEFRTNHDTVLNEFDQLMDGIKEAWSKRADIAHNVWCRDEKTGQVYTIATQARAGLSVDRRPMELKEIEAATEIIYQSGMELLRFLIKYRLLPPLPPRNRRRAHMNKAARKKRRKKNLG